MLALQDKSATVLLELPVLDDAITLGDRLTVTGNNCTITRSRFGIQIPKAVVNNDRRHSALRKAGSFFLEPGFQPICLAWFNGGSDSALLQEYAGPGGLGQKVPGDLLWRQSKPGVVPNEFQPGLDFAAYNGDWSLLPDFAILTPVTTGVATNFSLA